MTIDPNLAALYQEIILDHNKNPKNFGKIQNFNQTREGLNPICGDHYHLYANLDQNNVNDISFEGSGCAISKASASMMTEKIKGKSIDEAIEIFTEFQKLLTKNLDPTVDKNQLGKLEIFSNIWKYPARVKCAGLIWHTLNALLNGRDEIVKTE